MFGPDHRLVVGIEDDPDGSLRVYLGARYTGIHTHVADPSAIEKVRRAWGSTAQHLTAPVPADALCDCAPSPDPDAALRAGLAGWGAEG